MVSGKEMATWCRDLLRTVENEIRKVIVGMNEVVEGVLVALAAGGHVLLEGVPGLGKTMLVRTLAQALNLKFSRIQFTPDLMPADITGTDVLTETESGERTFVFRPGPIFANIILADEINRATPKTQSALLEAMQEFAVTVGGKRYILEPPFWVMATQNPIEMEGTYPLPEAQVDRFFFKLLVPYPSLSELREIVDRTTGAELPYASPVASKDELLKLQRIVRDVPIAEPVRDYALKIVLATHPHSEMAPPDVNRYVRYGASPRAGQTLLLAGKVYALLDERYNVSREDIKKAVKPALRHRIILNYEAEADQITTDMLLERVVEHVERTEREPIAV
ncbi:MAG: MoxR family ATPase [Armatimonadota bacterium]|nr:MoxR family ATPase [Armatimonadota bacterium]MDW8026595.1 MoxR family ATPase [Armatimonadota bacterium]